MTCICLSLCTQPCCAADSCSLTGSNSAAPQSIAAYAAAYRSGSTSPLQVAERIVAEIDAGSSWNPPQHYLVAWNQANIMQQAEDSAARCWSLCCCSPSVHALSQGQLNPVAGLQQELAPGDALQPTDR